MQIYQCLNERVNMVLHLAFKCSFEFAKTNYVLPQANTQVC